MKNNIFQKIVNNIDYVSDNLINHKALWPTDNPRASVLFEKIVTIEEWQSLIKNDKGNYKNLIQFVIEKKIFIKSFHSRNWEFNSYIIYDIIKSFQFYLMKNCSSNETIFDIKHMPYYYYEEDLKKVLNSYRENYSENIKHTELYQVMDRLGINFDDEDAHFLDLIYSNITEEIIVDYFTDGQDMDFLKHQIFTQWYSFSSLNRVILFTENPDKRRNFNGILTQKNLNIKNIENFYLKNEIYIPVQVSLTNTSDPTDIKYITPKEFKNLNYENLTNYEYKFLGDFNPILIDDIFYTFKREYINDVNEYIHNETDKIDIEYNLAFDFEEKNKLLRLSLKEFSEKIKNIDLSENLLSCNENLDVNNSEFHEIIKKHLYTEEELIETFLVEGSDKVDFEEYDIFNEWRELCYNKAIIDYIKLKLNTLLSNNTSFRNNNNKDSNTKEYQSNIWLLEIFEEMFHNYLIHENVIDKKHKATSGFKDAAGVILRIKPRIKAQIIKKRVTRKLFAQFLMEKYNVEIDIKQGFKIGNSDYPTEGCEDYIQVFLNKNSN
jgi:hypothetical protein